MRELGVQCCIAMIPFVYVLDITGEIAAIWIGYVKDHKLRSRRRHCVPQAAMLAEMAMYSQVRAHTLVEEVDSHVLKSYGPP